LIFLTIRIAIVPPMAPTITNAIAAPMTRLPVHRFAMPAPLMASSDGTAAVRIKPVPGYPGPAREECLPVGCGETAVRIRESA
jgi:hypothetical protein